MAEALSGPFPITCPKCLKSDGWPFRATTRAGDAGVELELYCRACGHEWKGAAEHDAALALNLDRDVEFRVKIDRRHAKR